MAECPGVYRLSLMRDGAMARLRVPGGEVTVEQLRAIVRLTRTYGNGVIDLTNRANFQIRGLATEAGPKLVEDLRAVDLLCDAAASDRLRNITGSPLTGFDETELLDVRPAIDELDAIMQSTAYAADLSVKFSLVVDSGGYGNLRHVGHDIGFFARPNAGGPLFEVSLAGISSGYAMSVSDMKPFVETALAVVVKIGGARIREVLVDQSAAELVGHVATLADVPLSTVAPFEEARSCLLPLGSETGHLVVGVPLSRMTDVQMDGLANLASEAAGIVRLTPWQSVVIPQPSRDMAVEAEALGFDSVEPAVKIIACAGARGCERTEADTKADGLRLRSALGGARVADGVTIHLSGCPRGCAMPGSSGILALALPESANYALYAGSRPSTAGANPPVRSNVSATDLPTALRGMLDTPA